MADTHPSVEALDEAFEERLAALGDLAPDALCRLRPGIIDDKLVLWPSHAIGRLRVVRRTRSLLFLTQGLLYPWNDLHPDGPSPLGYELAVAVPAEESNGLASATSFGATPLEELAQTWPVELLWHLADAYVLERWDLRPRLDTFGLLTTLSSPPRALKHLVTREGFVGFLVGTPFGAPGDDKLPVGGRLVMLQLLHPDEYEWVVGVDDASRSSELVGRLDSEGIGHHSLAHRASVLVHSR